MRWGRYDADAGAQGAPVLYPMRADFAVSWASCSIGPEHSAQKLLGIMPRTTGQWLADMGM